MPNNTCKYIGDAVRLTISPLSGTIAYASIGYPVALLARSVCSIADQHVADIPSVKGQFHLHLQDTKYFGVKSLVYGAGAGAAAFLLIFKLAASLGDTLESFVEDTCNNLLETSDMRLSGEHTDKDQLLT